MITTEYLIDRKNKEIADLKKQIEALKLAHDKELAEYTVIGAFLFCGALLAGYIIGALSGVVQ